MRDPAPLSRPQGLSGTSPKRSEEPLPRILQARAPPSAARFVPPAYTSPTRAPRRALVSGGLPHPLGAGSPEIQQRRSPRRDRDDRLAPQPQVLEDRSHRAGLHTSHVLLPVVPRETAPGLRFEQ